MGIDMTLLREAIEVSWDEKTSFRNAYSADNMALGQCYPTSRVIQLFYPETEIVEGEVWTGTRMEKHFWNILSVKGAEYHIDLTWQQFPCGSVVKCWKVRDRDTMGDSDQTTSRVNYLLDRVEMYLLREGHSAQV